MTTLNCDDFETDARKEARACSRAGFAGFALAFNHFGTPHIAHRYSKEVQAQFLETVAELIRLIEDGEIEANPAHAQYLAAESARRDGAVQSLIKRASRRPSGASKGIRPS